MMVPYKRLLMAAPSLKNFSKNGVEKTFLSFIYFYNVQITLRSQARTLKV
jgi:hypothetical protein